MFNLDGKTALVTGASSGLGAHFARVLGRQGAKVMLAARRTDRLAALVHELEQDGIACSAHAVDVSSPEGLAGVDAEGAPVASSLKA